MCFLKIKIKKFTVRVGLPGFLVLHFEQTWDQKNTEKFNYFFGLLSDLSVLTIICCALKLSRELLKQTEAMKAIFKNTHKGGKSTQSKEVV